ncbi:testin-like [Sinocyclocheilus rhinocerous]|uniref:Testin n=1 Tax=Sinocyclocheilus rhinocerous TaxID=307959 RepID=A0A673LFR9_9TELE|nr:PREDICTED: testin-like [Sinocyclocheilus rhinocerous]
MEIEKEVKKITLGHEIGAGAACLKCKDKCEGFELHFWRKICRNCKCGVEDHDVQLETEENKKVGKLFEDTKYTGLIAKLKRDGIPSYRGNQVTICIPATTVSTATPVPAASFIPGSGQISAPSAQPAYSPPTAAVHSPASPATGPTAAPGTGSTAAPGAGHTAASGPGHSAVSSAATPTKGPVAATTAPVPAKTDVVKSVTYEWAPPGINQSLALRYIELLPPERRPIAGTAGADYRKKQMAKQLPDHDQDPERCHELSPGEVKQMQQYVRKYKDEALGVGDITLPEEMGQQAGMAGEKGPQGPGAGGKPGAGTTGTPGDKGDAVATMGKVGSPGAGMSPAGPVGNYSCHRCQLPMKKGEPAVYAERAGYDKLWHPACFVCCTCTELLVDMIYFWKKGQLYCGRHYGDSEKPRCAGCDELIFSNEYTQAEGHNWHLKHFCCFDCDCVLAGETYVMENEKPVCKPCYMKHHAVCCAACQNPIEPEAQRVSYGEHHWHAEPQCFQCSCCSKCLMGQRFMAMQGMLLCSVECKKKITAS